MCCACVCGGGRESAKCVKQTNWELFDLLLIIYLLLTITSL